MQPKLSMANHERSESGRIEGVLPPIPAKRYFTIGEVSELCLVKPYVLRYWEQEFAQLRPMKRRGNRRYYQHHEVLLIRRIRELLYERGFTISGARNELAVHGMEPETEEGLADALEPVVDRDRSVGTGHRLPARAGAWAHAASQPLMASGLASADSQLPAPDLTGLEAASPEAVAALRATLLSIRDLLS